MDNVPTARLRPVYSFTLATATYDKIKRRAAHAGQPMSRVVERAIQLLEAAEPIPASPPTTEGA